MEMMEGAKTKGKNAFGTQFTGSGELLPAEFLFRLGLLLGAGIFFIESIGFFTNRGIVGIGGLLIAVLVVTTMSTGWRVLGDWRRKTQLALMALLIIVLAMPISAALAPDFGSVALPASMEAPVKDLVRFLKAVPGLMLVINLFLSLLSFMFLLLTLVVLLIGGGGGWRGGIYVTGTVLFLVCLLFHPNVETLVGFTFLGLFLYHQWETPLLVPDLVRKELDPVQTNFLIGLLGNGSYTTGEARIYLDDNPGHFAQLLELQYVELDAETRLIYPGNRLLSDPSTKKVERALGIMRRVAWVLLGITYFILPDFIPGPIDDMIVLALCTGSGLSFFNLFRAGFGRRIPPTFPGRPMR